MVVLQEPENVLPRLGSFPRSHVQEKVWETENENNPPIRNHDVKWETSSEPSEDSPEDTGKGKESTFWLVDAHSSGLTEYFSKIKSEVLLLLL